MRAVSPLLLLSLLSGICAQDPSRTPAAARAAQFPPALATLVDRYDCCLWIGDPYPIWQRILGSPQLQELARHPGASELLRSIDMDVPPEQLVGLLPVWMPWISAWIPTETVVGFNDATLADALELATAWAFVQAAGAATPGEQEGARDLLRQSVKLLRALRVPTARLEFQARTEAVAQKWFDDCADWLSADPVHAYVELQEQQDELIVEFRVAEWLQDSLRRAADGPTYLRARHLLEPVRQAVAALPTWPGFVRREGSRVLIQIGDRPAAVLPVLDSDVAEFAIGPRPLIWARWNVEALDMARIDVGYWINNDMKPLRAELIDQFLEQAELGHAVDRLLTTFDDQPTEGAVAVRLGHGVDCRLRFAADPDSPSARTTIAVAGLLRFAIPDLLHSELDAVQPLDEFLLEVRERLDEFWWGQTSLSYLTALQSEKLQALSEAFEARWGRLQEYLEAEESAVFERGAALLVATGTEPAELVVEGARAPQQDAATAQPPRTTFRIPGVALIGIPTDVEQGHAFAGHLAAGVRHAFDPAGPVQAPAACDVGLGVPTWQLNVGPCQIAGRRLTLHGSDAAPHYFFADRYLVISSSISLSRRLLAAAKPDAVDFDDARAYRVDRSQHRLRASAAAELRELVQQVGRATDGLQVEVARATTVLQAVELFSALCADQRSRTWIDGTQGFTRFLLELR